VCACDFAPTAAEKRDMFKKLADNYYKEEKEG
jgi:hypothetical protein